MTQKQPDKSELEIHHAEVLEVAEDAQDGAVYDLTEDGDKRRRDSIFTITASGEYINLFFSLFFSRIFT